MLELAMIWQLLQVRKLDQTPLVLIGPMWAEFIKWGQQYFLRPEFELAGPADRKIPHCVETAAEAVAIIRPHYEQWLCDSGSQAKP